MTDLAITGRCLEQDLLGSLELEVAEHVVEVFVQRRGQDPESGETMARVGGPLRKLHADLSGGRSVRAVTWYDRRQDVCWLLGAGMHDDFYTYVEALARTDAHLPTATDLANFEADAPDRRPASRATPITTRWMAVVRAASTPVGPTAPHGGPALTASRQSRVHQGCG